VLEELEALAASGALVDVERHTNAPSCKRWQACRCAF
jgi:hypothetical protein